MSAKRCPSEAELLRFVDQDLTPEQLERVARHLSACAACAEQRAVLSLLITDLGAPVASEPLALNEHVAAVMSRLDVPIVPARAPSWVGWRTGLLVAAAAAALLVWRLLPQPAVREQPHMLVQAVSVDLYAEEAPQRPLASGQRISASSALTVELRNLSDRSAYLLLFAVDARQIRHWLTPRVPVAADAGAPPALGQALLPGAPHDDDTRALRWLAPKLRQLSAQASEIPPGTHTQKLERALVLRTVAPGPLRIIALITRQPSYAAEIELLPPEQLSLEALHEQFPQAQLEQLQLDVSAE